MPLVAIALLSYAAGLLAGLHAALGSGGAIAAALLLAAGLRKSRELAACAALTLAGLAVGRAAERADHACRSAMLRASTWDIIPETPVAPGEMVAVRVLGPGCAVRAWGSVVSGAAPAGATVRVEGTPRAGPRGLALGGLRVVGRLAAPSSLARWRDQVGRSIDFAFAGDAPLARALLVADMRALPAGTRDEFAAAGLVHMLSISGLHVGIIAFAVQTFLGALGLPRQRAAGATVAITAGYVALIGAPAPALRAVAMLAAAEASRALQRPTSPWAALAVGAATPLVEPRLVDDIGYQLSVAGMVGLIASGALERRIIRGRIGGWGRVLAGAALTSVVASLVTGPLVAWRFGRASLVAPLTNVVATPVVGLLQPILFVAMLLGWWPAGARFAAGAAHPLLAAFVWIAHAGAAVPGAQVEVAATRVALLLAGAASVLVVAACVRREFARPLCGAIACAGAIGWLPTVPSRGGRVELHMIDVGQGDALALRTPRGRWILFDAGRAWTAGDAGRSIVVPYLRARGGELHAFVLSHPHADHAGGAASVIRALRPTLYVDAGYPGASGSYRESLIVSRETGTRWQRAHPGDSLAIDGVVLTFLAPDSAWTAGLDDANLASTVVRVRYGTVRFLLTGDAEAPEEEWLLRHEPALLAAEVLKVAHHGSVTSTTPPFLAAVKPRVALISVGAGNSYGHPGAPVLSALASAGAEVLRTDRLGSVIVSTDGVALSLHTDQRTWELSP
ncbi:MAG TPA: DNA internalization-related competence protein ComEC/Rec2 [Gemmatimonadaceae bacterium]|nr:DNA internalization-related competence protein ComEC/Rec2 [Gemmatimonadaceae bacterium]